MELTEFDRAAIERIHASTDTGYMNDFVLLYEAGIRAGLERAAKVCDADGEQYDDTGLVSVIAKKIRALTSPASAPVPAAEPE